MKIAKKIIASNEEDAMNIVRIFVGDKKYALSKLSNAKSFKFPMKTKQDIARYNKLVEGFYRDLLSVIERHKKKFEEYSTEFEKKPFNDISKEQLNKFMDILNEMSPENLSWDGERSQKEQKIALQKLQNEWKKLERKVGRKVSTTEIYKYMAGL